MFNRFVAYYRVSTDQQGRSGLGLEAQQATVRAFVEAQHGQLAAEFEEVESGKHKDRPELAQAIELAKMMDATLVIAKLDRLARNAFFLLSLRDAGVKFVACDMPHANNLTITIMAAVAEEEAAMISQRTKAALQAARERGVKLGGFRGCNITPEIAKMGNAVRSAKASARAEQFRPEIERIIAAGHKSLADIAQAMNERNIPTPSRRGKWAPTTVMRILQKTNHEPSHRAA